MVDTERSVERRDRFVTVDGTEIHCSEWGEPDDGGTGVVCVHGFSRNGRDFDALARTLAVEHDRWVVCPDAPGRGLSEWSQTPAETYTEPSLATTLAGLCDELEMETVRWVGTSMGGALGIRVAASHLRDRIDRLVLNDIGPVSVGSDGDREGIERIRDYLSNPPTVRTLSELEEYFRDTYGENRPNTDVRKLTLTSARRTDDGYWTPSYDPAIVDVRFDGHERRDLWDEWNDIEADVFVLRGEESDILSAETLAEMTDRKPTCEAVELSDIGHAPSLTTDDQIDPVVEFVVD